MRAYILSIAGAVLLSAVVTMIAPSGKMGKFVKGTMKLLILIIMLSPVASWLRRGDFTLETGTIGTDTAYLEQCADRLEAGDETTVSAYLEQEFSVRTQVETQRAAESGFPMQSIFVKVTDFGIIGQDEHIDMMSRIKSALEEKYGCTAVVT